MTAGLVGRPTRTTRTAPVPGAGASRPRRLRRIGARLRGHLWWITPVGSVGVVVPVSLLVAVQIPDTDYRLFYDVPRVISVAQTELFLLAAAVLVLGTLLPLAPRFRPPRRDWPRLGSPTLQVLRTAERVSFLLTVIGYVLFALVGAARGATPAIVLKAIVSQDNYGGQLKVLFAPVAGVTSLTQVGIAYVVISALLLCQGRDGRLIRRLALVLFLGLLRSYLFTERLALLELLVPVLAIGAANLRRKGRGRWLPFAPLFALPVLLVVFGAFEYSRSWQYYKTRTTESFPLFVVNRLAGYYATSYNNGALQLDHNTIPGRLPYDSIQGFWTAPGISQLGLYQRLAGQGGSDLLNQTLAQYGNPEFNNPGGLAVPIVDFGPVYGVLFFFVLGLVVGLTYRSWRAGETTGLLVYPVLFTGLLELPRYLYWTEGRVVPAYLVLGITAYAAVRAERRVRLSGDRPVRRVAAGRVRATSASR